jgi:hypothetical protein
MRDLSLHLMDIAQNAITAGADCITVSLTAFGNPQELTFEITDNGKGMAPDFLNQVTDPFKTTRQTRDVGLGLPLIKQSCELTGGRLEIKSREGYGTTVKAVYILGSIDRIPVGDIAGTLVMLIMSHPDISWSCRLESPVDTFELSTQEIIQVLNGVSIAEKDVLSWIQNTIQEGIKQVFGGVLDEVT